MSNAREMPRRGGALGLDAWKYPTTQQEKVCMQSPPQKKKLVTDEYTTKIFNLSLFSHRLESSYNVYVMRIKTKLFTLT